MCSQDRVISDKMGVDSDVREYHRRREAQRNAPEEAGPQLPPNFTPRNVRVKREKTSPEVDFKTRMKMMSKSKAKTNTWIKKEDPDGPKIKKEKSRRKKSESEDSEEEDRRITRKAKKKLGLSVSYPKKCCHLCR